VEVAGTAEAVATDAWHIEWSIYRCGWGRIEVSGAAFGEIRASLPGAVGTARTSASEIGKRTRWTHEVCAGNQFVCLQVIRDRRPWEGCVPGHHAIDLPAVGNRLHKVAAGMHVRNLVHACSRDVVPNVVIRWPPFRSIVCGVGMVGIGVCRIPVRNLVKR